MCSAWSDSAGASVVLRGSVSGAVGVSCGRFGRLSSYLRHRYGCGRCVGRAWRFSRRGRSVPVVCGGEIVTRSEYFATAGDTGGRVVVPCRCGVSVSFMLHHDAKTAPGVRVEPSGRAVAVVANAFPLPAGPLDMGGSCPGATSECRNCYAAGLESWAPAFRRGASANLAGLRHLYGCGVCGLWPVRWSIWCERRNERNGRAV